MFVGAYLPWTAPEARDRIELSGETIAHRTSSLHRRDEMETFDLVVVLEGDPHGQTVAADYTGVCEVRVLTFEQLITLGEPPAQQTKEATEVGSRDESEPDRAPRAAEAAAPAPEAPAQGPKANGSVAKVSEEELRAMKRPALLKYAAARYPGQRMWIRLGNNDNVCAAVLELGG